MTTIGQRHYTVAEAAVFLGRSERFVEESVSRGTLASTADGQFTREALLDLLAVHDPRLLAVIEIAQVAVDNDEEGITTARLRELGIVTSPDNGDGEGDVAESRALLRQLGKTSA
jgi:hypothetical protein